MNYLRDVSVAGSESDDVIIRDQKLRDEGEIMALVLWAVETSGDAQKMYTTQYFSATDGMYLFVGSFVRPSVRRFICLFVCLLDYLFVCFVCLFAGT